MSVVITTYTLAGGFIEAGMNWWQAMITILLGNTIVLIPMILNAHAGTKYGVSFPVLSRAAFGTKGANVPAMLRAIVRAVGSAFRRGSAARRSTCCLATCSRLERLSATVLGVALHTWIAFFVFWGIQVFIILKGVEGIKYLETWSAPLAAWVVGVFCLGRVASGRTRASVNRIDRTAKTAERVLAHLSGRVDCSVGYWATLSLNIPDFTRYARSQKSQMLGQAMGLPLTMTAFAFIGVA
jgi:NCS1 family nucleobase:cation symporter-1